MLKIVFLIIILFVSLYVWKDVSMRTVVKNEQLWVQKNNKFFQYALTDLFDKASSCASKGIVPITFGTYVDHCDREIRRKIDLFGDVLSSWNKYRKSIYFIRLRDSTHIEKLFQSGTFFIEDVNTQGEKTVVETLQGKRAPFPFPLYTCRGDDDILCLPFIVKVFPRVYLDDFYSEIELIYPIKNSKQEIIGAVVYLYGD